MIRAEGIREDYKKIADNAELTVTDKIFAALRLVIELLINIRTNQTDEGRKKAATKNPSETEKK